MNKNDIDIKEIKEKKLKQVKEQQTIKK